MARVLRIHKPGSSCGVAPVWIVFVFVFDWRGYNRGVSRLVLDLLILVMCIFPIINHHVGIFVMFSKYLKRIQECEIMCYSRLFVLHFTGVFVRKDENQTRNLIRKKKLWHAAGISKKRKRLIQIDMKEWWWHVEKWRTKNEWRRCFLCQLNYSSVCRQPIPGTHCIQGINSKVTNDRGWKLSCGDSKTMQLSSISTELYTYYTWNQCHHLFWTINSSSKWSASHSAMAARNWSRWSATRLTLFLQGLAGRGIEESDGECWLHMQHLACNSGRRSEKILQTTNRLTLLTSHR